jgi:putative membrane protein
MIAFLLRTVAAAVALWMAGMIFSGLKFRDESTLLAAALLLGIVNAIVRPIVLVLTLPLTLLSLGSFLLVINAAMLALVAWLLPGFTIAGFWTACGAALLVTIVSWLAASLFEQDAANARWWRNLPNGK